MKNDKRLTATMRRLLLMLQLIALPLAASAQETENFGAVWTEVGVTKVLPYNFSLEGGIGFRTFDWFNDANRFDASLGLSYKLGKYFKFGLSYTFIEKHYLEDVEYKYEGYHDYSSYQGPYVVDDDDDEYEGGYTYRYQGYNVDAPNWAPRHRVSLEVTADKRFWKTLRISLRERYQFTHQAARDVDRVRYRDPSWDADGNITEYDEIEEVVRTKAAWNRHLLRSRLKFAIDKKGLKWEPFFSIELHNDMGNGWDLDKVRTITGVEYAVSKLHKISAGYVFNHENDIDGDQNIHALSLGYKFKF